MDAVVIGVEAFVEKPNCGLVNEVGEDAKVPELLEDLQEGDPIRGLDGQFVYGLAEDFLQLEGFLEVLGEVGLDL